MGLNSGSNSSAISSSTDVSLNSPVTGNVLAYDGTVSKWKNAAFPAISGTNTGDQTLAINGSSLSISGSNGNTVTLPTSGGGSATTTAGSGAWTPIGDSITDNTDTPTAQSPKLRGDSWVNYAALLSDGALYIAHNAAVQGTQTDDILSTFDNKVPQYNPTLVTDLSGTNDARGSRALSSYITNKLAIVNKIRAIGATPVWGTVPPQGTTNFPVPAAPSLIAQTSGGTLDDGTYSYRVTAVSGNSAVAGETTVSAAATVTLSGGGGSGAILINIPLVADAFGYRIYGRTGGNEKLITTFLATYNCIPQTQFLDTGSITPTGAQPSSNTTGVAAVSSQQILIAQYNAWMRGYGIKNGIPVIDFYGLLTDPATGLYKRGLSHDGVHPNPAGMQLMGALAWETLSVTTPPSTSWTGKNHLESINFAVNPLYLDSLSGGSWALQGTPAGATLTANTKTGFIGKALTLHAGTKPPTSGTIQCFSSAILASGGDYSAGDLIRLGMRVQVENNVGAYIRIMVFDTVSGKPVDEMRFSGTNVDALAWQTEFTIPSGTTSIQMRVQIYFGTADVSLGEQSFVNLTDLGLSS